MTTRLIAKTACGKGGNNLTRLYNCSNSDEYQVFADFFCVCFFFFWLLLLGFLLFFCLTGKGQKKQNEKQGTAREKKSPAKQPIIRCLLCQ